MGTTHECVLILVNLSNATNLFKPNLLDRPMRAIAIMMRMRNSRTEWILAEVQISHDECANTWTGKHNGVNHGQNLPSVPWRPLRSIVNINKIISNRLEENECCNDSGFNNLNSKRNDCRACEDFLQNSTHPTTISVVVIEKVHGRMGVPPMIGEQFSIQKIHVRFLETYTMTGRSKFLESSILQFG